MKKYLAEAIGTFALVFCGTAAIVIDAFTNGAITQPVIALTLGLIVMVMIYAFGDISGGHFNPAVTLAFAFAKKFKWKEVTPYLISQILGAIVASGFVLFMFPESETLGATIPQLDALRVFVFEVLLTFFLMIVIINVSTGSEEIGVIAGIAVGGIIVLEAMFAGAITGASKKPARSVAPAQVS